MHEAIEPPCPVLYLGKATTNCLALSPVSFELDNKTFFVPLAVREINVQGASSSFHFNCTLSGTYSAQRELLIHIVMSGVFASRYTIVVFLRS